jgi:UDP-glucose:(heptosyl)LPS alpha-1,3-glucosyltransferase
VHNEGYDAVVGFNKMPGLDFYYAADPCFAAKVEDRPWFYALFPRTKSFLRAEEKVFSRHSSTHALLISPAEMDNFSRIYHTPPERMHLLPPGIQRDRIAPPDYAERRMRKRKELGVAEGHNMLLMVGSGFKTKGVDRSLHALAVLPDHIRKNTRLFVVGHRHCTARKCSSSTSGFVHCSMWICIPYQKCTMRACAIDTLRAK